MAIKAADSSVPPAMENVNDLSLHIFEVQKR